MHFLPELPCISERTHGSSSPHFSFLSLPPSLLRRYLLRAREQVITASVHRDNCIVVKPDGTFHMEQGDQKEQPKPDVYTGNSIPRNSTS